MHIRRDIRATLYPAIAALCTALAVSGCTGDLPGGFAIANSEQSLQGPQALVSNKDYRLIDLVKLLDPSAKHNDLSLAAETFTNGLMLADETTQKIKRNAVQDRIIASSKQQCSEYIKFIKKYDSETNLILGGLATTSAGVGAIVTPVNTVRALSGIAAILSGIRAENNDAFFQRLTIQVIADGLESEREEILSRIHEARKGGLVDYGIWQAIGDASEYHGSCSAVAGLKHAALTIERSRNPGIAALKDTLGELKDVNRLISATTGDSQSEIDLGSASSALPLSPFLQAREILNRLKGRQEAVDGYEPFKAMASDVPLPTEVAKPANNASADDQARYSEYLVTLSERQTLRADVKFLNENLRPPVMGDKKTVLAMQLGDALSAADTSLTEDAKAALIAVQSEAETLRAEAASLESGTAKTAAAAKALAKREEANHLAHELSVLRDKLKVLSVRIERVEALRPDIVQRMTDAGVDAAAALPVARIVVVPAAPPALSE